MSAVDLRALGRARVTKLRTDVGLDTPPTDPAILRRLADVLDSDDRADEAEGAA